MSELQNNNTKLSEILGEVNKLPLAVSTAQQTLTEGQKTQARKNIDALAKGDISLGIASDGLIYLFVNGQPVGTGIPQGQSGDVFGYVDENNTIVLNGNLADGTYTLKYEMSNGDIVNIGNMVLDSTVYYTVTSNLTNCSISNSAKTVAQGESYSATITANDGYELKSVTVTMGGSAVSVSGGVINIASVTGNIVITAVAEEIKADYTNLADPTSADWKEGYRINSSAGPVTNGAVTGSVVTNFIGPIKQGDVIRVQGIKLNEGGHMSPVYKPNKSVSGDGSALLSAYANTDCATNVTVNDTNAQFTVGSKSEIQNGYWRFSGVLVKTSADVIITINEESVVPTYTITNNLTNCANSNSITSVQEGSAYSATITANDGYELKSVTVTMGGSAVSVSGGVINIASVTGDIVITAVAEEVAAAYTNLADPSSSDWYTDCRLGSDGTHRTGATGCVVTNYINVKVGDVVRVKGMDLTSYNAAAFNYSKACVEAAKLSALTASFSNIVATTTGGSFTVTNQTNFGAGGGYVRFSGAPNSNASNIIITVNEEIV